MIPRGLRFAPVAATVVLAALVGPVAVASAPIHAPALTGSRVGHLAFVTKNNQVHVVVMKVTGNATHDTTIGPMTAAPSGRSIAIQSFVGSPDGNWVAWVETITKRGGGATSATPTLVLREFSPAQVYEVKTSASPIGFAGDTLVVYDGVHASTVELKPSIHLVTIPGASFPQAAYPGGVINEKTYSSPPGRKNTDQLRQTAFDGTAQVVHNYILGPNDPRLPERSWVSPDGRVLAVERGDHTDFGGIGPSSVVDEFALTARGNRAVIGHYGTAKKQWRVGAMSFAWKSNEPWAVWERGTKQGAASVIAVYQHGAWRRIIKHGIAVAGERNGFVIVQAGKYVFDQDGLGFSRVPTGDALLLHDTITKVTGVQGRAFAWVN